MKLLPPGRELRLFYFSRPGSFFVVGSFFISVSSLLGRKREVWKTTEITPLPEQGNHGLPINNRPISLLPALSKVCERMAYNQFVTYLTTKERPARLTTKQSGNKTWFPTETSLIHTTDAFLKGIDDKRLNACVLLDMSKTLDNVDHQILLRKIQRVGASTSALKWFKSYLTNRYQVVRIHSSVSDPLPVECGVPQGSILGPLLFSIYVNDLPEVPRHCSTECYVDDTKLSVSFNLYDSERIVQEMKICCLCATGASEIGYY